MAVAAGEVQIAQGEEGELLAVQREVVVDPQKGVAQEIERVLVAVPDEEGNAPWHSRYAFGLLRTFTRALSR